MKKVLSLFLALLMVITLTACDNEKPVITLTGDEEITLEVGETYVEPGATVEDNKDDNIDAVITGEVDTSTLGTYEVIYNAEDSNGNEATTKTRTIYVVDTTDPVITINGNNEITIAVGGTYTEEGATATDNYDTSITVDVTGTVDPLTIGEYTVTYEAEDSSGNIETITRTVYVVDLSVPLITLNGDDTITIEVGGTYTELGANVVDNVDTNLSAVITGTVDTTTVGSYTVYYDAVDTEGNNAIQVMRTVEVVDVIAPVITLNGDAFITLAQDGTYTEAGAAVTDNYDSNLQVTINGNVNPAVTGTYMITYEAIDSSGNSALVLTREVVVEGSDGFSPLLDILGDEVLYVALNGTYVEYGYMAYDDEDTDVDVVITGTVDVTTLGSYIITYTATDDSANETIRQRVVIVENFFMYDPVNLLIDSHCISPTVCIKRDTEGPIYNEVVYPLGIVQAAADIFLQVRDFDQYYDVMDGALFTEGACNTNYQLDTFHNTVHNQMEMRYGELEDETMCLKVEATGELFELYFTHWGSSSDNSFGYIYKSVEESEIPYIMFDEPDTVYIEPMSTYYELGAVVGDNVDEGELEPIIIGTVDTSVPGVYYLDYHYVDTDGNSSPTITRKVIVSLGVDFDSEVQLEDCIREDMCISRGGGGPMYNTVLFPEGLNPEEGVQMNDFLEDIDTLPGIIFKLSLCDVDSEYFSMVDLANKIGPTFELENFDICMYDTVTGNQYILNIIEWAQGYEGGYVTYSRYLTGVEESPFVMINGDEVMILNIGDTFVEPGIEYYDNDNEMLTPVITGTVDTSLPGSYLIEYMVTDLDGNISNTAQRLVVVGVPESVTLYPGIVDCITENVCFARDEMGPIYNDHIFELTPVDLVDGFSGGSRSPMYEVTEYYDLMMGMEFSYGACEVDAEFMSYSALMDEYFEGIYPYVLESPICGKDVYTDEMFVIDFITWGQDGGGIVQYTRTRVSFGEQPEIMLQGDHTVFLDLGEEYVDPGVIAYDLADGFVDVVITHAIDINTPGYYEVVYTAIDNNGLAADPVTRMVSVYQAELVLLNTGEVYCFTETACIARDGNGPWYSVAQYPDGLVNYLDGISSATMSDYTKDKDVLEGLEFNFESCHIGDYFMPFNDLLYDWDTRAGDMDEFDICVRTIDTHQYFNIDLINWGYSLDEGPSDNQLRIAMLVTPFDPVSPQIRLNGADYMRLHIDEMYTDPGVILFDDVDTNGQVVISGDVVDTSVEGNYTIIYNYTDTDGNEAPTMYRTVNVSNYQEVYLDTTHRLGDCLTETVCLYRGYTGPWYNTITFEGFAEYGDDSRDAYEAIDVLEGAEFFDGECSLAENFSPFNEIFTGSIREDITTVCLRTVAEHKLFEITVDNWESGSGQGMRIAYAREYIGYYEFPVVDLLGEERMYVQTNSNFTDPGATVRDNIDTNLTVIVTGDTVDTSVPGVYYIMYTSVDSDLNESVTRIRTVLVGDITTVTFNYGDNPDCITPTVCLARDEYGPLYDSLTYPLGIVAAASDAMMGMSTFANMNNLVPGAMFALGTVDGVIYFGSSSQLYPMGEISGNYFTVVTTAEERMFEFYMIEWESQEDVMYPGFSYIRIELPYTEPPPPE